MSYGSYKLPDNGRADMDVWQIGLYGFAAFVSLRLLVTLMDRHRLLTLQKLVAEHRNKLAAEQAKRKEEEKLEQKAKEDAAEQDNSESGKSSAA